MRADDFRSLAAPTPVLCTDGALAELLIAPESDDASALVRVASDGEMRWLACGELRADHDGCLRQVGSPPSPRSPKTASDAVVYRVWTQRGGTSSPD